MPTEQATEQKTAVDATSEAAKTDAVDPVAATSEPMSVDPAAASEPMAVDPAAASEPMAVGPAAASEPMAVDPAAASDMPKLEEVTPVKKQTAKRAASTRAGPPIVYAEDLDFKKHCYLHPLYTNKQKGFRLVKCTSSEYDSNPLRIQFSSKPNRISDKFGVDTNMHGKTFLTFSVECSKEYDALVKFQEDAIAYAKENKDKWWSTTAVTEGQVEDNAAQLVSARKEKKDGDGLWPGNMKALIPLNDEGELKDCVVHDHDGQNLSYHDLPGTKTDKVIVELSSIYFQNKCNWGFGPKTLRFVSTKQDESKVLADIDFSDIVMPRKTYECVQNDEPVSKKRKIGD